MLYLGAKKSLLSSGKTLEQQVAAMFAGGEQGAWYEPSLTNGTLFQDSAGTTPVTAVGQPVGLMLDKRLGLVRGAEKVVNGRFDAALTSWTDTAAKWAAVNGRAYHAPNSVYAELSQAILAIAGPAEITFDVELLTASNTAAWYYINAAGVTKALPTTIAAGASSVRFIALDGIQRIAFYRSLSYAPELYVDNISVRELPGNPALQATVTARPLNQAAPARLVFDAVDDQHVTTFLSALGSNCTIVRSVPGVGASILTGQTIGTTYTNTVTHSGLLIISRALTASETISATKWANQRAFA